jgi:DNA-binding MarR family transcriptional regulator
MGIFEQRESGRWWTPKWPASIFYRGKRWRFCIRGKRDYPLACFNPFSIENGGFGKPLGIKVHQIFRLLLQYPRLICLLSYPEFRARRMVMVLSEIRLMQAAIALAEELNFSRAAERLNLTQPALSKQIIELEGMLGFRLFERNHQNVELTDAGRAFVEEARDAVLPQNGR